MHTSWTSMVSNTPWWYGWLYLGTIIAYVVGVIVAVRRRL